MPYGEKLMDTPAAGMHGTAHSALILIRPLENTVHAAENTISGFCTLHMP